MKKIKMKKAPKKYEVFDVSNCDGAAIVRLWTEMGMLREVNKDRSDDWTNYNLTDWREGWFHFVENDEDGLTCPMAVREYKAARKLKRKGAKRN